ncbi:MAG: ATP-binding protein [Pedobacter sp.]|uniref:hybrid sensor histidine kinase/response regulator transcription factor n=1 Tax=Pedobacter sp. TaxID=1411316 RepID=UPI003394CA99
MAQQFNAFTTVESSNGLSDNNVRSIGQLPDGRMMVITEGMVNFYNGSSFQYIHLDDENLYPLRGYKGYHYPYLENNNRLWIKRKGQLMLIDLTNERYEKHPDSILTSFGLKEAISDFFMDAGKNLWFVTVTGRLYRKDPKEKTARLFLAGISIDNNKKNTLFDIALFRGEARLFYRSGIVVRYDVLSKKETGRENAMEGETGETFARYLHVVNGNNTLYLLSNLNKRAVLLEYQVAEKKWKKLLDNPGWLNDVAVNREGSLAISSRYGLWMIGRGLKPEFISTLHLSDGKSFSTEVTSAYYDLQGGLWISTLYKGLLYTHQDRLRFTSFDRSLFKQPDEKVMQVTCFVQSNQNDILVGTNRGLYRYQRAPMKLVPFSDQLKNIHCNYLYKDSSGRIWICATAGLYCISGSTVQFYPLGEVNSIMPASGGLLYVSTEQGGVLSFNPAGGTSKALAFKGTEENWPSRIKQMIWWKGELIGSPYWELFVYHPKDSVLQVMDHVKKKPAMFRHNNHQYNCLFVDSRGMLWFATQDGLNVWDDKDKKLQTFHTGNGLINNAVKSLSEDAKGAIWISTANGISRIIVETGTKSRSFSFSHFNRYDGLMTTEFSPRSSLITTDGYLLMGGVDGFNELKLDQSPASHKTLNPVLVSFRLFGTEIIQNETYQGNKILENAISATKSLKLKHDQNFFSIDFSALNYANPSHTFYRYRLEGVDHNWNLQNTPGGIGHATYTDIAPGTYLLKIQASENGSGWTGKTEQLLITITAPWWATSIAIIIYCLTGILLIYLAVSWYIRKTKARQLTLQAEKLDQLKFNFFTNISHELRTPLTLIMSPLEVILKNTEDLALKQKLSGIYRNATTLLNLVNQLLNFRKLELNGDALHLGYCNLEEYIESVCLPFDYLAASKDIAFKREYTENPSLYFDKNKLEIIVNNLLSNSFKFTPKGGQISMRVMNSLIPGSQRPAVLIIVQDTGLGISKKDLPDIFNVFFQSDNMGAENTGSGIGLHLVKEYAELHEGTVSVQSVSGSGTEFSLYIPADLKPAIIQNLRDQPEHHPAQGIKLLIAEDNTEFRNFLLGQLEHHFDVIAATNGREALDMIFSDMPDLVISDVMMPEMSGIELCDQLKRNVATSHIPVILLTARYSDENQGYQVRADAYITKPFNIDLLFIRIRNLLEQQEQRKNLFKNAIIIQPSSVTTSDIDEKLIRKALAFIEKNMSNSLYSVEELSSDMNMERSGLYRKLMAIIGQTPSAFIRSVRLKKAAQLLIQKEFTIAEISDRVGFSNAGYFSKCFQEEFAQKPSQYAEKNLYPH